jgi:hypothetical protein
LPKGEADFGCLFRNNNPRPRKTTAVMASKTSIVMSPEKMEYRPILKRTNNAVMSPPKTNAVLFIGG